MEDTGSISCPGGSNIYIHFDINHPGYFCLGVVQFSIKTFLKMVYLKMTSIFLEKDPLVSSVLHLCISLSHAGDFFSTSHHTVFPHVYHCMLRCSFVSDPLQPHGW